MTTQEILNDCTIIGNTIKLPKVLLDYETEYKPIKKKLEGIGGKWMGGKTEAFVFEQDPAQLLSRLQEGQQVNLKKDFQFFATPEKLGMYLIGLSPISLTTPNIKILEPSAGDGALIKCIRSINPEVVVDCFELMDLNRKKLLSLQGAKVIGKDFLHIVDTDVDNYFKGKYDLIIANPPFTNNQDIDHIKAMYECLKIGGSLVSISSKSWVIGSQKKQIEFKKWLESIGAKTEEIEAGKFKKSGTLVGAMIIILTKGVVNSTVEKDVSNKILAEKEIETEKSPEEILGDIQKSMSEATQIFNDLKTIIKKEEQMNFFNQLSTMMGDAEITFTVKRKEENITVMMVPKTIKEIRPLILSGTAEEMDAEFFKQIESPLKKAGTIMSNVEEFEKQLEKVEDNKTPEVKEDKKTKGKKEQPKEDDVKKAEEEAAKKAEEEAKKKADEEEKKKAEEEAARVKAEQEKEELRVLKIQEIKDQSYALSKEGKFKDAADVLKTAREIANEQELAEINTELKILVQKRIEAEMLD